MACAQVNAHLACAPSLNATADARVRLESALMRTNTEPFVTPLELDDDVPDSVTDQIAQAVWDFETNRTGGRPRAVSIVLNNDILVIKRHRALEVAERQVLATDKFDTDKAASEGLKQKQHVLTATDSIWQDIERITGRQLKEYTVEAESRFAATIQKASLSGVLVQVFRLV
jgi:uncharacterized protein YbcI